MTNAQATDKLEQVDEYLSATYQQLGDTEQKEHKLFMSAALLRRLVTIAQNIGDVTLLYADPGVQDLILTEIIRPRTERGKEKEDLRLEDFPMSEATANQIMGWAIKHILNFFTDAVSKVETAVQSGPLKTLLDSLSGLQNLTKLKASAGPTTADAQT